MSSWRAIKRKTGSDFIKKHLQEGKAMCEWTFRSADFSAVHKLCTGFTLNLWKLVLNYIQLWLQSCWLDMNYSAIRNSGHCINHSHTIVHLVPICCSSIWSAYKGRDGKLAAENKEGKLVSGQFGNNVGLIIIIIVKPHTFLYYITKAKRTNEDSFFHIAYSI